MEYISIKIAAEKWNISVRSVQIMCKNGLIPGAQKWERSWMLPADAARPADRRVKKAGDCSDKSLHTHSVRKTPLIVFTNLYAEPGTADKVMRELHLSGHPGSADLFSAGITYFRGDINAAYNYAEKSTKLQSDFYTSIGNGMILSLCAMYRGDERLWAKAKNHIWNAPYNTESEREGCLLWLAATDSALYSGKEFPKWFTRGCFDILPPDSYPLARFFYAKLLLLYALEIASGRTDTTDSDRLGLMRVLPNIIKPMISQSQVDRVIIEEIYLRLLCATAYHNIGNDEYACIHIDKAISLALPDRLYSILAEHLKPLDSLLDKRIADVSPQALAKVKGLQKQLMDGWIKLHNKLLQRSMTDNLSMRENEVAKLAAFGLSNKEIAKRIGISINSVKSIITMALNKTGASDRKDLVTYI